ncbi:MAG: hypothetical protein ACE5K2_02570 [Candidatus Zixiibacteriota bacterium]
MRRTKFKFREQPFTAFGVVTRPIADVILKTPRGELFGLRMLNMSKNKLENQHKMQNKNDLSMKIPFPVGEPFKEEDLVSRKTDLKSLST